MTPERAEIVALQALAWLAGDDDARDRLLAASGLDGDSIRANAGDPAFLGSILAFLLSQEELLLRFCAESSSDPAAVQAAGQVLAQ
jgi:hypothetical protein